MRFFRKVTHICQNCVFGNNDKGKRIHHWWLLNIYAEEINNRKERTKWHIWCEKKRKFLSWDRYKRCFIPQNWVIKSDFVVNRNAKLKKHERIIFDIFNKRDKESEIIKHIIKEGSRNHVITWSSTGKHCNIPNCEINKPK